MYTQRENKHVTGSKGENTVDLGNLIRGIKIELINAGIDPEAPLKMSEEEWEMLSISEIKNRYPLEERPA